MVLTRGICHTGNHRVHIYVPWMQGAAYDHECDICGHRAALDFGKPTPIWLCDCCAQDWHEWCDARNPFEGRKRLHQLWWQEYHLFKHHALEDMAVKPKER